MTTLKDYKEKVQMEFDKKFRKEIGVDGDYADFISDDTLNAVILDGKYDFSFIQDFLSLAIDNAVAEAFKAVEVPEGLEICSTDCFECSVRKTTLQQVEDRKKQYLV